MVVSPFGSWDYWFTYGNHSVKGILMKINSRSRHGREKEREISHSVCDKVIKINFGCPGKLMERQFPNIATTVVKPRETFRKLSLFLHPYRTWVDLGY